MGGTPCSVAGTPSSCLVLPSDKECAASHLLLGHSLCVCSRVSQAAPWGGCVTITSCPPSLTAHGPPHGLSFNLTLQGPDINWWHRQVGNHLQWMGEGQGLTAQVASLLPKLTPEHKLTLKSKFSGFSGHHRQQQHCQTPLAEGTFSPNRS